MANARQFMAARTGAWAKSGGWVNPYVTDGLIIMLDGEWNLGQGLHQTGNQLCELVSGQIRTLSGGSGAYFDENSIILSANENTTCEFDALTSDQMSFTSDKSTFEICAEFDSLTKMNNNNGIFWTYPFGGASPTQHWLSSIGLRCWNGLVFTAGVGQAINEQAISYGLKDITASYCSSVTGDMTGLVDYYLHGQTKSTFQLLGSAAAYTKLHFTKFGVGDCTRSDSEITGMGSNRLRIHSIRLYNRMLTPSEIAANYAIDKARFNLPDET